MVLYQGAEGLPYAVGGGPYLRDEDQSQRGCDRTVGMEEEEEKCPVWVQGRNQHKPEGQMGQGDRQQRWEQPASLTSLTLPLPQPSPAWQRPAEHDFFPLWITDTSPGFPLMPFSETTF